MKRKNVLALTCVIGTKQGCSEREELKSYLLEGLNWLPNAALSKDTASETEGWKWGGQRFPWVCGWVSHIPGKKCCHGQGHCSLFIFPIWTESTVVSSSDTLKVYRGIVPQRTILMAQCNAYQKPKWNSARQWMRCKELTYILGCWHREEIIWDFLVLER